MAEGVMLSAVFFLPTVFSLNQGKGGELDWNLLTSFDRIGNPLTVISGYNLGAVSSKGSVSLFCGSFILVGVISFFIADERL